MPATALATDFGAAMQIAVNVQRPVACGGLGGQAVYIDTEGSFAPERVEDMCRSSAAAGSAPHSRSAAYLAR